MSEESKNLTFNQLCCQMHCCGQFSKATVTMKELYRIQSVIFFTLGRAKCYENRTKDMWELLQYIEATMKVST